MGDSAGSVGWGGMGEGFGSLRMGGVGALGAAGMPGFAGMTVPDSAVVVGIGGATGGTGGTSGGAGGTAGGATIVGVLTGGVAMPGVLGVESGVGVVTRVGGLPLVNVLEVLEVNRAGMPIGALFVVSD